MVIQRAGDVIPQIVDVVIDKRPADAEPYEFPHTCPVCGSPATREVNEKTGKEDSRRRCTGELICPAQAVERLRHFVSRGAMDIEGLGRREHRPVLQCRADRDGGRYLHAQGPARGGAARRCSSGAKSRRASARRPTGETRKKVLSADERTYEGLDKLFAAIDARRKPELDRFIFALGIRHVGDTTAALLARTFSTVEEFIRVGKETAPRTIRTPSFPRSTASATR